VLAPQDLAAGDTIAAGTEVAIKAGNCLPLKHIPVGMPIHSIEMRPGGGGQLCRAAGCVATIVNKQDTHAIVRLPSGQACGGRAGWEHGNSLLVNRPSRSAWTDVAAYRNCGCLANSSAEADCCRLCWHATAGEQRLVHMDCHATVGAVSNPQRKNRVIGKAGLSRHAGRRPTVRGVAMNPVDHPHGGRTAGGRPSVSPWGMPTKGFKTRSKRKPSSKCIVVTRHQAKKRA
jgi:large subunit ribosomal protein L2